MQHRTWLYFRDIVKYGHKALAFAEGMSEEQILADERTYLAIERCLFIVGEAVSTAVQREPETAELLSQANQIRGFRNLLAHGYFRVERARAVEILRDYLPKLIEEAAAVPEPPE
jgi:uncharacterized protein with HEPN domain